MSADPPVSGELLAAGDGNRHRDRDNPACRALHVLGKHQPARRLPVPGHRDHLGVAPLQWRLIGACELAGVAGVLVGLMWAPIGIAAAIGLALLSIGAIAFHVRASDSVADTAPAVIGLALAVAIAVLHTL